MESKESARLKEIRDELKGIKNQLSEQNKQLKRIVDIFDKQWHGDATATINNDGITVTPYVTRRDIDTAFANLKKGIEDAADEMRQEEQNKQLKKGDTNESEE